MKFKSMLVALILMLTVCAIQTFAQDKVVTGKVTDSKDGSSLINITVQVKGSKSLTQTDSAGIFKIKVPNLPATLVFTSVGFANQEAIANGNTLNISLVQTSTALGEVIVIAYGTTKKGDLTGAVTSVGIKDFQKGVINSSEQLLQGKVAGLQITSGGGSAGGGSRIRIRGGASLNASNDPLIVVDGIPVESNGIAGSGNLLNTINPNDIESMSVLKDASATALYGSRASNGVLIITTKKGTKGQLKYNFNSQASVGSIVKKVAVLTGEEIRSIINADAVASGNNTYKNLLGTANTDWQNEIYRSAIGFDNNLSASGSLGVIPFRASFGMLNQDGVLKTDNFKRISTALNLSPKFFDKYLAVNINLKYSQTKNRFADQGAIGNAVSFDPTKPVFATNKYGGYFEWLQPDTKPIDLANRNPLGLLDLRNNNSVVSRLIGNIQLDYKLKFFPDLHVLLNLGVDNSSGSGDDNTSALSATNYRTNGRFTHYSQKKKNTLADISLLYAKELSKIDSKIDLLAGHSYQDFITEVSNYASYGENGTLIPGSTPAFATDKPQYRLESYFGRLNYTLSNKYLLTASIRRDASSKFSADNRVGYFPAVAAAWKLRDEFFKNSRTLVDLKLRVGWGITGQQDVGNLYPYLPRYSRSTSTAAYQFGNSFYTFLRPSAYDANIRWETTTTSNLGLDFAFFDNRISGSIDVYQKTTKDLLSVIPVAPGSNFDITLLTNVGNMENKGVEFTLNTVPLKTKDLIWDFGFNITYNQSKITNLLKQEDPNFKGIDVSGIGGGTGNNIGKFLVGYAPYTFNVFKQVYDKGTGNPIEGLYEDINRDGKIDDADRYNYKKPAPDLLLGFNTQVAYKKWTVGIAAHSSLGNYLYNNYNSSNAVLRTIKNPINFIGNASRSYLDTKFNNNQYLSDLYIENASFLRIDNLNIGYNAGKVLKNKASLRVNISVQNLLMITKYKGLDPENSNDSGVDGNIYPRPRIISLGVNFDF